MASERRPAAAADPCPAAWPTDRRARPATRDDVARSAVTVAWLMTALGALLLVHVVEPDLPLSWSYAGLHLAWGGVGPALATAGVVFVAVVLCWRARRGDRPARPPAPRAVVASGLLIWLVLVVAGLRWPAPDVCPDAIFLPHQLQADVPGNVRWLLSVPLLRLLFAPFRGYADPDLFLRAVNAAFSTVSIVLTAAIALRLGRSLREQAAIVLLTWSALGSLQLVFGYVDIYPVVQLFVALYLWTAIRYLDGDGSVTWPLLVAAAGPWFYIGLILLGPSVLVLLHAAYERGQIAPVLRAVALAILLAGLATVPAFGRMFAFPAWLGRLSDVGLYGLNPGKQTLPLSYMLGLRHAGEVLSTLVLLDGVGVVLLALLPVRSRVGLLLFLVLLAGLAFVVAMDPLWGPFSDWDLFSYLTLPVGIGAGLGFARWSRGRPRVAGLVLGLALAVSTVHLFARLNLLHLDFDRHRAESPFHIPGTATVTFIPSLRRSVP